MRILKTLLGIGMAIGFGALAQTASQTSESRQNPSALPNKGSETTPQNDTTIDRDSATDQSELGTGGSGDGGVMRHHGKHMGDGGMMRHRGKHKADAGM